MQPDSISASTGTQSIQCFRLTLFPDMKSVEVLHRLKIAVYALEIWNRGVKSPLECAVGAVGWGHTYPFD